MSVFNPLSAAKVSKLVGNSESATPRLDALSKTGVDVYRLKTFLDEFGQVLVDQTILEAFAMLKSQEFRDITSPAEALSEGAACFPTMMISLGREWDDFAKSTPMDEVGDIVEK